VRKFSYTIHNAKSGSGLASEEEERMVKGRESLR